MDKFIFFSGEFSVSIVSTALVKGWEACLQSSILELNKGILSRKSRNEDIKGLIFFADMDDKKQEEINLKNIIHKQQDPNFFAYPDPNILIQMIDRHKVQEICKDNNLISHDVAINVSFEEFKKESIPYPIVVKVGLSHRGMNKFKYCSPNDIVPWNGKASVEPFFSGESVRILFVGDDIFPIKIENDSSWIKNSPGANVIPWEGRKDVIDHALKVKNIFKLDVVGIDYIISNNEFHFLEINQFPALSSTDDSFDCAKIFFINKMREIKQ